MLTKFPEEKNVSVIAVPGSMGRLNRSTERLSGVGETNVGIMRDVNGTQSHWEIGSYLYPRTQRKTVGVK